MTETIRVWRGLSKRKRCGKCRQLIMLAITDEGKTRALDADAPILRTDVHPTTFAKFDVYSRDALHVVACPGKARKR